MDNELTFMILNRKAKNVQSTKHFDMEPKDNVNIFEHLTASHDLYEENGICTVFILTVLKMIKKLFDAV